MHSYAKRRVVTSSAARNAAASALALIMFLFGCWAIIPAFTFMTLALAVVMPEVAPISAPLGVVLTLVISRIATGATRRFALALAATADLCLGWPLVAFPFVEHAAEVALYSAGAPQACSPGIRVDINRNVPVPLRDHGTLALDLYRPRMTGIRPLLVTIYGGAWMFGSRVGETSIARRYAACGYEVAAIDYRHSPRYRFPTQIHDVEDALRTIASHARQWHVDTQRVALFGRSSGAQLALLASERPQPLRVRATIAYYAPSDLVGGWNTPPSPDPAHVRSILTAYLGGPPDTAHHGLYNAASPLRNTHSGLPPTLLIIGERDQVVLPRFQRSLAANLRAKGVTVVALELPWANHAFDEVNGIGAYIAHEATAQFLATTLR